MVRVLFVCLGNICRSPAAEGVFRQFLRQEGLHERIDVDSAGTGAWHIGQPPDARAIAAAAARGFDLSRLRARQITSRDFTTFDHILAMDRQNLQDLHHMRPPQGSARVALFLDGHPDLAGDVPDPYFGDETGFDLMLDLIEAGAAHWLDRLRAELAGLEKR